ncbi:hypothetical protein RJ640_019063 [Escallonia rubra]|uniref:Reverse transcriptase Ty1/copia-type domain-containing protein n=1 Tax=Escallonia rubra TaxID=112253 RepID=A0AA88RLC0_9ASTE|nr:hypothetical protein RJ640_019063 [Escallonia rubra]
MARNENYFEINRTCYVSLAESIANSLTAETESPSPRPTSPILNQLPVTPSSLSPPSDTHSTPMSPAPNDPVISIGRPLRTHKPPSYLKDYHVSIARSNSSSSTRQGSNVTLLQSIKARLRGQFHTKDLGSLKYFLGIEVARSSRGLYLCQRKYTLDILDDCGLTGARPSEFPMEQNLKLSNSTGAILSDPSPYRRLKQQINCCKFGYAKAHLNWRSDSSTDSVKRIDSLLFPSCNPEEDVLGVGISLRHRARGCLPLTVPWCYLAVSVTMEIEPHIKAAGASMVNVGQCSRLTSLPFEPVQSTDSVKT